MANIVSWNIRGLNWPNKQEDVKIFMHRNKVGLIGLLETKVKIPKVDSIAAKLFPNWRWSHNFHLNTKGRIWLAWKPDAYNLEIAHITEQLIHCKVTQAGTNKRFYLTMVYGMNHEQQRAQLWQELQDISDHMIDAWCIMGDFNAVMYKEDRIGGNDVTDQELAEIQSFVSHCELQELPSTGSYYSWTNKTIWSRIDRVFINHHWYGTFDYTHTVYMAPGISDHTPLQMQFHNTPKPKAKFQYCDMWSAHSDFSSLIASHKMPSKKENPLTLICHYLTSLRPKLAKLHRVNFSDLKAQQVAARDHLTNLQDKLHHDSHNKSLLQEEKEAREHYVAILNSSMALIQQQCKIEWIKYGDDCTKFFFAKAKQRKMANYIYSIQDHRGQTVEGFDNVGKVMNNFYRNTLGTQETMRKELDPEIISQGPTLSREQQIRMCRDFTEKDIKEVIFSIPNSKSPGPDGYSSGFFKSTWTTTGPLVCAAIRKFLQNSEMPGIISETRLVLLPKIPHPQHASDFRPISCCNVLYKCISKLLCQRLKEVLPHIINPCQGAFIKGREILYNMLICQDLARGYQRKHISPRCLLKFDLQKAFDSVHWGFLKDLLNALRFPKIFTSWIMACVTTVNFIIHINGQDQGSFKGGRGLRQGDPLSPMLFVLTMEYFSRLMSSISLHKGFSFTLTANLWASHT